jgi:hypothetical protein
MNTAAPDPDTAARMHAVAAALTAAGLTARVHITRGVLDVTATWEGADGKGAEVIVDDDGYVEVRYWNYPWATPAQVGAVIVRALAAITATQRTQPPPPLVSGRARHRLPGR